jgi:hypothetical protein
LHKNLQRYHRTLPFPKGLPFHFGYQADMRLYAWVRTAKIGAILSFIPDEVIAPQFKQPVMDHPIVMNPDGPYMPMDISIPNFLRRVAHLLDIPSPVD